MDWASACVVVFLSLVRVRGDLTLGRIASGRILRASLRGGGEVMVVWLALSERGVAVGEWRSGVVL